MQVRVDKHVAKSTQKGVDSQANGSTEESKGKKVYQVLNKAWSVTETTLCYHLESSGSDFVSKNNDEHLIDLTKFIYTFYMKVFYKINQIGYNASIKSNDGAAAKGATALIKFKQVSRLQCLKSQTMEQPPDRKSVV